MLKKSLYVLLLVGCVSCSPAIKYPEAERVAQLDEYFGVKVADPYRWLEEDVRESERVSKWVERENEITRKYLDGIPEREQIKERLTELWDYDKVGVPSIHGEYYIQSVRHSMDNHSIVYKMKTLGGDKEVLFNPNTWSDDGTVALAGLAFSDDGKYVAYGIQESGSDWRTWKVRDVASGKDLPDVLEDLKFTSPSWDHKGEGFYYSQYPVPDESEKFTSLNTNMKVMYHKLGDKKSDDKLIHEDPEHPTWNFWVGETNDGRYLIMSIGVGTDDKEKVLVKDLHKPDSEFEYLVSEFENSYVLLENDDNIFYFQTDRDAPMRRVIAMDINHPEPQNWKEIVPEEKETLAGVSMVNEQFLCSYLKNVTTQVKIYSKGGEYIKDIVMPGVGTGSGFGGRRFYKETFYSFSSYNIPPSIFRYDMATGESTLVEKSKAKMDPDKFVTEQVFFMSKDGTKVPMFVSYMKGTKMDGSNPTLLYGYGGFSISLQPRYSLGRQVLMENGFVVVTVNLRGGGEYGESWHEAGKRMQKQNVFDDFIGAAEYMIENKYTSAGKIAIMGGSNGGLLVGAVMLQRPELFGAAVPEVGVMDMLRFDNFTAGRFWVDEYGSSKESKEMFEYLLGYSPYHNIRPGVAYPATLVMTADTDDRVVPGHSFKFAARLQHLYDGDEPMLIRIETKAGHGSGKPTSKVIEEIADIYAFMVENTK